MKGKLLQEVTRRESCGCKVKGLVVNHTSSPRFGEWQKHPEIVEACEKHRGLKYLPPTVP